MSSYSKYCRDQAAECERRARVASSPDVAENYRVLEARWRKLAEKADFTRRRPVLTAQSPAEGISLARRY